jgi:hypothetical protein
MQFVGAEEQATVACSSASLPCGPRGTAGPSKDGGPSVSGPQGPAERERMGGVRATARIEDIWREKIRGCSYRGGDTSTPERFASKWAPGSDLRPLDSRARPRYFWGTEAAPPKPKFGQ